MDIKTPHDGNGQATVAGQVTRGNHGARDHENGEPWRELTGCSVFRHQFSMGFIRFGFRSVKHLAGTGNLGSPLSGASLELNQVVSSGLGSGNSQLIGGKS